MKYPDVERAGSGKITGSVPRRSAQGQGLIPAVITRLHHPVLDSHRKTRDRFVGGGSQGGAAPDAETGPVPGTDDLIAVYDLLRLEAAAQHGRAVMGTDVFQGVITAVQIEDG